MHLKLIAPKVKHIYNAKQPLTLTLKETAKNLCKTQVSILHGKSQLLKL